MSEEIKTTRENTSANNEQQIKDPKAAPALPPHKIYTRRLVKFRAYYSQLLITMGILAAISVVIAVAFNLIIGVAIAIATAIIYAFFVSDEMYKKLGIKYTSISGGLKINVSHARYGNVLWIPSNIIGLDVIEIGDRAFLSENNEALSCVFLPSTLKKIGENIFENCSSLTDVHFEGSEKQWRKIENKTDFSALNLKFDAKYPPLPKKKTTQKKSASKKAD